MVVGSKMDMLSDVNFRRNLDDIIMGEANGNLENSLKSELESMLRVQRYQNFVDQERDLNICRSGSAPPTVEGSLNAVGSLFMNRSFGGHSHGSSSSSINGFLSEDEIRSHPAYLSYYYSNDHLNPRLPTPLLSKEDWRIAQRFQAIDSSFGGIRDLREKNLVDYGDSSSLFSMQPGSSLQQQVEDELMELRKASTMNPSRQTSGKWLNRGSGSDVLIGASSAAGLGVRRKSFADILQEGLDQPPTLSGLLSRPASRNAFGDIVDTASNSNPHSAELCNGIKSKGMPRVQSLGSVVSHSFASGAGSALSRSRSPDPQLVGRSASPGLPPVLSRVFPLEKNMIYPNALSNGLLSSTTGFSDISASLSGLNLSKNQLCDEDVKSRVSEIDKHHLFDFSNGHNARAEKLTVPTNYTDLAKKNNRIVNFDGQVNIPRRVASSASLHTKATPPGFATLEESNIHSQNNKIPRSDSPTHVPGGYSASLDFSSHVPGPTLTGSRNRQSLSGSGNHDLHSTAIDTHFIQYLQRTDDYATHGAARPGDPSQGRNYFATTRGDLQELQKAYVESLLAQQKQQYELPLFGKSVGLNHGHYIPSSGSRGPTFQNEQKSHFTSMLRTPMGGSSKSWNSDTGTNSEGRLASSLLEELKNNKNRSLELSDIIDHVVEFSTDQYGSRFIQQKLETAAVEEKAKIFSEIMPHSRTLMTDVFGNYVIQKFFEHGSESQRKELASQLTGHVLPLSLQMYGCRVIQKALEVVDVDQQTQMVAELDGSIMKCVRDQNGNHVIQKCIECVPQDRIQFIISSFFGQVVILSTHPYGCRVIQRVLEHCDDLNTQQIIMEEVMQNVCTLAQDQYGNYVIQHVLQHGKPQERSAIISKLAGQIVKMSQQKFASNVVEKCLTFGGPKERQLLVNEMLGSTDENEPLQAMMKDPFGNYVVQKVLETCGDQSRELILSRIKVHLNTLKRYTYGKHIVSRVEKLVTAGERCIGLSSSHSS